MDGCRSAGLITGGEPVICGEKNGSQIEAPVPALLGQTLGETGSLFVRADIAHQKGTDTLPGIGIFSGLR